MAKEHRGKGVATGLMDAVKAEGVTKAKGPMSPAGEKTARATGMEIVPEQHGESEATMQRDELHMQQQRMGRIDRAIADYKPDRSLARSDKNGGANEYSARNVICAIFANAIL